MTNNITILVLTYNEEMHIKRFLEYASKLTNEICVIDSGSTDNTVEICQNFGAKVYQNPFESHARQLNWAITNCNIETEWVLRLDADEYIFDELCSEILQFVKDTNNDVNGCYLRRRNIFMGKWIRFGGYYPIKILRLWRHRHAICEDRFMDEHMSLIDGKAIELKNDFVDHNLQSLDWWIEKHNWYASKEASQFIWNNDKEIKSERPLNSMPFTSKPGRVRLIKVFGYDKAPLIIRPIIYFLFRYFFQLGVFDGPKGFIFHFFQGLWYRMLVDAKIIEIKRYAKKKGIKDTEAVKQIYGFTP